MNESPEKSMSQGQTRARPSRLLTAVGLAGVAFLSAFPIGQSQAQTPLPPSLVESASYVVELTAIGTYQTGLPSHGLLTIKPKAPYGISKDYPWTVSLLDPPSDKVLYTKKTLTRADMVATDQLATFKVGFVPGAIGKGTLLASTHLQVCAIGSPTNCVTNYVNTSLTVPIVARAPRVDDKATDGRAPTP